MRASQKKTLLMWALGGVLLTGFQNCGGAKFNGGSSSATQQSVRRQSVPVLDAEASVGCAPLDAAHATRAADVLLQGVANVAPIADVGFLHLNGITAGDVLVENAARVIAQNLNGGLTAAALDVHVLDVAGPVCLTAGRVTQLQNVRGLTHLNGVSSAGGQRADLGPVLDVRDTWIENFSGPLVQNVHGHLTLKNTVVHTVKDVTGRIDLIGEAAIDQLVDSPNEQVFRDGQPVSLSR